MRSLAILLCLLLWAASCSAHTIAGEYDLVRRQWTWETAGSHPLTEWLSVGYSLRCLCDTWVWKAGIVPSWVPIRQDYEVWAQVRRGAWTLRVMDWCNHWLAQSHMPAWADEWGLTLRVQWEW